MLLPDDLKKVINENLVYLSNGYVLVTDIQDLIAQSYMTKDVSFSKQINDLNAKYNNMFTYCLNHFNINESDRKKVLELCEAIVDYINNIDPVEITLAFKPDSSFMKTLYQWLQKNLNINTLIKVNVSEQILGGLEMSYNGKYYDLSLNTIINKYFEDTKANVLSKL